MSDVTLKLRRQRNAVFEIVARSDFSVTDFELVDLEVEAYVGARNLVTVLTYKPHALYRFEFNRTPLDQLFSRFSPGWNTLVESRTFNSLDDQIAYVDTWLEFLGAEVNSADLWRAASSDGIFALAQGTRDNSVFTEEEVRAISERLDAIEAQLAEQYGLSENAVDSVHQKFELLKESSRRIGRKDWMLQALGVLSNIAVSVLVNPEAAANIYWLFENGMKGLMA